MVCSRGPPGADAGRGRRGVERRRWGTGRGGGVVSDGPEAGARARAGGPPAPGEGRSAALRPPGGGAAAARQENTGLQQQAEERERRLAEALEQQTATAEVLRHDRRSPADLQRVLDAVAGAGRPALRRRQCLIWRIDGDVAAAGRLRPAARGQAPRPGRRRAPRRAGHGQRARRPGAADGARPRPAATPPDEFPTSRLATSAVRTRTMLSTPLLARGRSGRRDPPPPE